MSGCSPASIRNADIPALRNAGGTKAQFLAVWSENPDTGFSPAQLKVAGISIADLRSAGISIADLRSAGISIAEMRSAGIADYLVFNEACNTPQTSGTAPRPTIRLSTTTLSSTDTKVVLEAKSSGLVEWGLSGVSGAVSFTDADLHTQEMLGSATAELVRIEDGSPSSIIVATLSIPLADVFSNPTVTVGDSQLRETNFQLCPGS